MRLSGEGRRRRPRRRTTVEHEENRYELIADGVVVETEQHSRSPCVRWWPLDQALGALLDAGFAAVRATAADTLDPASADDNLFKVWGAG